MNAKNLAAESTAVERTGPSDGLSRIEQLGLSNMFRPGSATWMAAELLLAGEPITKAELRRRTGIVDTVVPRTIAWLRKAGIEIIRTQDKSTKQATYRAVIPVIDKVPDGAYEFFARKDTEPMVTLMNMTVDLEASRGGSPGDSAVVSVTLSSPLGTVTGAAPMNPQLVVLARGLPLTRVILLPGGRQEWILGHLPNTILVSGIAYVEARS